MFPCAVQVRSAVLVEMDADQAVYFKMIMHELQTSEVCCSSFPNIYKSYTPIGSEDCLKYMQCKDTTLYNIQLLFIC